MQVRARGVPEALVIEDDALLPPELWARLAEPTSVAALTNASPLSDTRLSPRPRLAAPGAARPPDSEIFWLGGGLG